MNEEKYQLTEEGRKELQSELEKLIYIERDKNLESLKEAREQGDLSENADYESARDEQARIESRIKEIEIILKNVEIIKGARGNKITLGKEVTIKFENENEEETYTIVGPIEADPLKGKISNASPVGKSMIGKKVEDVIDFKTENGTELRYTIIKVK